MSNAGMQPKPNIGEMPKPNTGAAPMSNVGTAPAPNAGMSPMSNAGMQPKPNTGEMPKPKELLALMKDKGVRAARMYPTRAMHNFSLEEWCAGDLLDALEEKRVPLMLDTEIVSWEDVHRVLTNHPELPVIMTNCTYRFNRYLYPMFEKFENLHVEMSRFMGQCCIEDVVARFGARTLVFGTNLPQYTGTAAVGRLTYADIEWKDKEAVASGNLKAILKESWR